jgi:ribosomal 50S subunit-recycling heat shock protein
LTSAEASKPLAPDHLRFPPGLRDAMCAPDVRKTSVSSWQTVLFVLSSKPMRIDQWLWAIRAFKSRTSAAVAVKAGKVLVDGVQCKPARELHPQEVVTVRDWEQELMLRVLGVPPSRVGASLVPAYAERVRPFTM